MSNTRANPQVSTVRANEQVWQLAEYLHDEIGNPWINGGWGNTVDFQNLEGTELTKEDMYDIAADLLKKIENREFTGPDNHE